MALTVLIFVQIVATAIALAWLWRRSERQRHEIDELRAALNAQRWAQRSRRDAIALASVAKTAPVRAPTRMATSVVGEAPRQGAARVWRLPAASADPFSKLPVPPAALRNFLVVFAALAPIVGFLAHLDAGAIVASGVCIGAAIMLASLLPHWRITAWSGVFTSGAWALVGFVTAAAHTEPVIYSAALPIAGAAGLAHAFRSRAKRAGAAALAPGATLALVMSAAALALGSQVGMIGAPGIAFAAIVSCAAVAGALNIKLEPMHLAAFGATLIGLFVMSGQAPAAIWFTPITAWAGALFLGIAGVRVPKIGARGAALAATGVIAPFTAISALYAADQGLADPHAAAAAFALLGGAFAAIIAASAHRHGRGLGALKLSLWLLAAGLLLAATATFFLTLTPSLAAPAFALLALGYVLTEVRAPNMVWRASAAIATALAAANAWASAGLMLNEAPNLSPWLSIGAGLGAPAVILVIAGRIATRNKMTMTAGVLEGAAIAIGMAAASLGIRDYFSGGAPVLHPIGFVEAGAHISVWLFAALLIAARSRDGARKLRTLAAIALGGAALLTSAIISVSWLDGYWAAQPAAGGPALFHHEGLGFAFPGIMFWAHWVYWRARGANLATRLSLGAGAMMVAALIALEVMRPASGGAPSTFSALAGALSIALAIVLNFAPGVVAAPSRSLYFEENLKRDRRREERREAG
jgi:hypothetical protein